MAETDQRLIQKIRRGNTMASRTLYDRHESYWFRICLRYGRNRNEAEDLFQEGVVKIFQVLDKFDENKGNFKGWSNRVLVNESLKYLKRHQWQESFEDLSEANQIQSELGDITARISAKELTELIQQLPFGYRMVFNLYEIEGFSHREIAEQLSISIGTSKSQLFKAKKMLQRKVSVLFE